MLGVAQNFLTGQIPASFGNCKNLYFLDLSSNNLSGSLPAAIFVPCVVVFSISQNSLFGNISRFSHGEGSNASLNLSMSYMDLVGGNNFEVSDEFVGSIPTSFTDIVSLLKLNLSGNRLQDHIPSYIREMKEIRYLSLSNNNFLGMVSQDLV
ncbi:hypothetical protein Gotur_012682 [Gossypium turneri]